jgi:hypothetical protein
VAKGDPRADLDQLLRLRGRPRVDRDGELPRRAPEQRRIAERLGSGHEQKPLRLPRHQPDLHPEACLDSAGQSRFSGQEESAGEAARQHPAGQLEQGKRVSACLRDDAIPDSLVERSGARRDKQFACVCF